MADVVEGEVTAGTVIKVRKDRNGNPFAFVSDDHGGDDHFVPPFLVRKLHDSLCCGTLGPVAVEALAGLRVSFVSGPGRKGPEMARIVAFPLDDGDDDDRDREADKLPSLSAREIIDAPRTPDEIVRQCLRLLAAELSQDLKRALRHHLGTDWVAALEVMRKRNELHPMHMENGRPKWDVGNVTSNIVALARAGRHEIMADVFRRRDDAENAALVLMLMPSVAQFVRSVRNQVAHDSAGDEFGPRQASKALTAIHDLLSFAGRAEAAKVVDEVWLRLFGGAWTIATTRPQEQPLPPVPPALPPLFGLDTACLRIRSGEAAGRRFALDLPRLSVGRADPPHAVPDIDLSGCEGDGTSVSRRHAEFNWTEQGLFLRDLGSRHGTFVNGTRLPPPQPGRLGVAVGPGDILLLGDLELQFDVADTTGLP
ncbi:MAG: FHA domain-containing protein [Magnetospirillum sp.]|nr:FHA domain-containing protein [Magnetospirillum sp.]